MERDILWLPWDRPGIEHLHLREDNSGVVADSVIIGMSDDNIPFRTRYIISCDTRWRIHTLSVSLLDDGNQSLQLRTQGEGRWVTSSGQPIPSLHGCIDVDIAVTPFTNTLPIRRLQLNPGESRTLLFAYITVPDLQFAPMLQRYTCLDIHAHGALYRYESVESGYTAELAVDAGGLVIDYPGLFRRV